MTAQWSTLYEALRAWIESSTAPQQIPVLWQHEAAAVVYKPYAELSIVSVRQDGADSLTLADPGDGSDFHATSCGLRLVAVQCRIVSREQDPSSFALEWADRLQASALLPSTIDWLAGQGVALLGMGDISILADDVLGRLEQQALFDLEVAFAVHHAVGTLGWFNRVRVSSDLRNIDGDALPANLQVAGKLIGPPP